MLMLLPLSRDFYLRFCLCLLLVLRIKVPLDLVFVLHHPLRLLHILNLLLIGQNDLSLDRLALVVLNVGIDGWVFPAGAPLGELEKVNPWVLGVFEALEFQV